MDELIGCYESGVYRKSSRMAGEVQRIAERVMEMVGREKGKMEVEEGGDGRRKEGEGEEEEEVWERRN